MQRNIFFKKLKFKKVHETHCDGYHKYHQDRIKEGEEDISRERRKVTGGIYFVASTINYAL